MTYPGIPTTDIDAHVTDTAAARSLRVYFPIGATVSVVIMDHRRSRSGTSITRVLVVNPCDGDGHVGVGNASGLVASVTGYAQTPVTESRVIVHGYGNPEHAVSALVSDLARALHGSSTALRSHVL